MGWKKLKTHFNIRHTVHVKEGKICIGSAYVNDIVTIDVQTAMVRFDPMFESFAKDNCANLLAATKADVLALIQAPDEFERSIPVYEAHGCEIIQKLCEERGWPNVTHDGTLMYENQFFSSVKAAVEHAKIEFALSIKYANEGVDRAKAQLQQSKDYLNERQAALDALNAAYPQYECGVVAD